MDYRYILVSKENGIGTLTMNNPKVLNALTPDATKEIYAAVQDLNADPEVRVVIVTGAGKAFIAGADISYMSNMTPQQAIQYSKECNASVDLVEHSSKPWIAAINGFALGGGCEFALGCDIRIASENAKFGLPEVGLGVFPGGGGTQRLTHLVGPGKAKELIFTADRINAQEALQIGLVNKVVAPEELMNAALEMANKILKNAPVAIGYAKFCINNANELGTAAGIEEENKLFGLCFATEDQKEGMAAFLEKRDKVFKGC